MLLRIKFQKENSERIVIFPGKIRNLAFFCNPERSEQGKLAPLLGKLLFARYSLPFAYQIQKGKQRANYDFSGENSTFRIFSVIPNDPSKEN